MGLFDFLRRSEDKRMGLERWMHIAIKHDILQWRIQGIQEWFDYIEKEIKKYEEVKTNGGEREIIFEREDHKPLTVFMLPADAKRRIIKKGLEVVWEYAIPWLRPYDNQKAIEVINKFLENYIDLYMNDKALDLILHEILMIIAKSFSNRDVEPLPPLVIYAPYVESSSAVPERYRDLNREINQRLPSDYRKKISVSGEVE